jgi:hypothetical protein
MSAGELALGLIHAAPALLSLPSVDLPLSFRSSHFSVGAHLSGVVVPNASPVVQLGLPGLCHLSAPLRAALPPFRLSSFPYPRVPVLYASIAAGPRQAAVATPVAGGCRFVPVGALVLGLYALRLRCGPCLQWIFGCFSALFASRVCSTMPPNVAVPDASPAVRLRLHCLATLSPCLGTCSLFRLPLLPYPTLLMLITTVTIGPRQAAVATPVFRQLPSFLRRGLVLNLMRAAPAFWTRSSVDLRWLLGSFCFSVPGILVTSL